MSYFSDSFASALGILVRLDSELLGIVWLTLRVSGLALLLALLLSIPLVLLLQVELLPGKHLLSTLVNTAMGFPPVVVGLLLYILFSRSGPFGPLDLLYTPGAMIIAQTILATPIIAGLAHAALQSADPAIRFTARTLGATAFQSTLKLVMELQGPIIAAVLAGFGRIIAEVGAVLIVGGNISGFTRVMTTAIALEADKGEFELAIALGIVLLLLSFIVNGLLRFLQYRYDTHRSWRGR